MAERSGYQIEGYGRPCMDAVLTVEACHFLARLHRQFDGQRRALLESRRQRQESFDAGDLPEFLAETAQIRATDWTVAPPPSDLADRRVEITGPVERKMMINALNSGARVFMADFEDANSPTWANVIDGQDNLIDAVNHSIEYTSPEGKTYRLNRETATLLVRPRGWHLAERHFKVDSQPISAGLFDLGLYCWHNARELLEQGSGPYFYLPKLEGHLEARLWNQVFQFIEQELKLPHASIRATVLIETILAAFEMDEILYELRERSTGLNAGRWDYMFSLIKKFHTHPEWVLPDRAQVTMTTPFMRAYTELLVKTCHRRHAHAIGGMAAFVPSRRDPAINQVALERVREDKVREATDGFDGTWVAHPDLVPVAKDVFDEVLGARSNQVARLRDEVVVTSKDLLNITVPGGTMTRLGLVNDVSVAVQYLESWLQGSGAVAIYNLMEDAATAEIARSQLWQWAHYAVELDRAEQVTPEMVRAELAAEVERLGTQPGHDKQILAQAGALLDQVSLSEPIVEFLTLPAYERID